MSLIHKKEILQKLDEGDLHISPLLNKDQIGSISIDLRVGTDFLTSQQGRLAFIDTTSDHHSERPIKSFFTATRRRIGESFLFHPNQTALFSTLEYLKLPKDIYAELTIRSSYSRLGLSLSTIIQPGYCGCASVEILYSGNTPIKILAGARLLQMRLYEINEVQDYFLSKRKYVCQVRPIASRANEDLDLKHLKTKYS